MSSHHITVSQLIAKLQQHPPGMLVAISQPLNPGETYEGILDGPRHLEVIRVQDMRGGFNPLGFEGADTDDWPVLLIAPWKDAPRHWRRGEDQENNG